MEKELRKSRTVTVFMSLWTNSVHRSACVKSYFKKSKMEVKGTDKENEVSGHLTVPREGIPKQQS